MFHLYFTGPLSPSKIADLMMVTRGNITSFIKRMIEDDLITTHQKRGQKRVVYGLTDLGIKHFERIFPRHAKRVCKLVPKMPANFVKQLGQIEKRMSTLQKSKKTSSRMS
jgi:DNA-binding MarR family transcriptional regulator